MSSSNWTDLTVTAFAAAGIGRLLAQDTILQGPRNRILKRWVLAGSDVTDIADEIRTNGTIPGGTDNARLVALSQRSALAAEGLSCPSCMSWWATIFMFALTRRRGDWRTLIRDVFATWALAAILTRKGG